MVRCARWCGAAGAMWLAMGCTAAERDWLGDILDGNDHAHSGGGHAGGGGGGSEPCNGGQAITMDNVYAQVASDLAQLDADDQATTRYFTVANEGNALGCGTALDISRQALFELVNSLSLDALPTLPVAVDAEETLYRIDLRDYQWDRPVEVGGAGFVDVWEALLASSVYAVEHVGDDADDAKSDTTTRVPVLPANAFVAAATRAPVYYAVLGIPEDLDAFIVQDLGVDLAANRRDRDLVRAGLEGTGLGAAELLLERVDLEVRAGYLWQVFSDAQGDAALLEDPLGTPDSQERELLFTLPNGLLAHALADVDGRRIDASDLTLDTNEEDFRAKVASSYLRLRSGGMTGSDGLRGIAQSEPERFSPEELSAILEIYPAREALANVLADDRDVLANALAALGGSIDAPDPTAQVFDRFAATLGLEMAAADLFVSPEFLRENLLLLAPELGVLSDGTIRRDDFDVFYLESLCILSVVNENQPEPSLCE